MQKIILMGALLLLGACARLDYVQVGDIDQSKGTLSPITVKVSENGVEMAVVAGIAAELASSSKRSNQFQEIRDILALMNMGPRTGNPVFSDTYAENILDALYQQCATGKITGIRNIREATSYGPISGEIVRIDADCIL
ncbi:hypothetical protein ACU6U9_03165 [Pseudomonas sp. HK3]|jgi:type IV pilus biogenesis protein CpaD/CtpE